MENKLIILSDEIYKFNKIYFDSLDVHLKIYKNGSNDDSFYRINHPDRTHNQYMYSKKTIKDFLIGLVLNGNLYY